MNKEEEGGNVPREFWREVMGFPDYEVSTLGRVRSWRGNGNGTRAKKSKILVPQIGTNGRPKFELCNGRRRSDGTTSSQTKYLHKIVAEAFIGPCPNGLEVRHIDGNMHNNCVENIVYGTHSENINDKKLHGTFSQGEQSNFSKLTENEVREIRNSTLTPTQLADKYNTSRNNIYLILSGKTWRHVK